ncbi:MAG: hypothetical protein U0Q19_09505 [Kineosporiaceae bacterium]
MVDGRPLRAVLTEAPGDESADLVVGDNVAVFVHSWPVGIPNDVYVLLGEQPPELAKVASRSSYARSAGTWAVVR